MKIFRYGLFVLLYYCIRLVFVLVEVRLFHLAFLDVGQGDAIVINIPNYGRVLVDAGFNYQANYLIAKGEPFPMCQLKSIIITHYDKDHVGGLDRFYRYCRDLKVFDNLSRGDVLKFNDTYLTILAPPYKDTSHQENDDSIVVLVRRGNFEALLAGDAGLAILENLPLNTLSDIDVYKVSHHGSKYNTSLKVVQQLHPRYCIISVGRNNFGHPSQEVLNMLYLSKCKVLRTDIHGTIVVY